MPSTELSSHGDVFNIEPPGARPQQPHGHLSETTVYQLRPNHHRRSIFRLLRPRYFAGPPGCVRLLALVIALIVWLNRPRLLWSALIFALILYLPIEDEAGNNEQGEKCQGQIGEPLERRFTCSGLAHPACRWHLTNALRRKDESHAFLPRAH